ncbi:hypothetical protein Ciccas_010854 [Cichlidogyrus casuarinus]|uniref:Transmembrane protein 245 n=1 Tax=Cichlidogyrus casuarinus TaxID=1844966 RepID=A0ABD2PSY9_9PLAT
MYLPLAFLDSLTPHLSRDQASQLSRQSFHFAVESAISSVFAATFKLAFFYGFYTVLTHQLFGVDFVVIPSVLAAIFGAIPILGNYWVAIPGIIDLVLFHESYWRGFLLFILHWLPTQFLDTAVYSEIKGAGHPYLTGLSIAGGIYCFGIEGALMGPIVLCCLLVAVNLFRVFMNNSEKSDEDAEETASQLSSNELRKEENEGSQGLNELAAQPKSSSTPRRMTK